MGTAASFISKQKMVGHSVEGRPIELIHFFQEGKEDVSVHPLDTLFLGCFHGDEGISTELLQQWLIQLTSSPAPIPDGVGSFALIPVVNPDGLVRQTRCNARGVDLNRNYPTQNFQVTEPGTPYYSGPFPGSEPETEMLITVIETYQPKQIITVHSPYRVINFDGPAESLALAMAEWNHYPVVDDIGYATPGSFGTYYGKERQVAVITLELPENEPLETVCRENIPALQQGLILGGRSVSSESVP
jgi:murein peptide amidase A